MVMAIRCKRETLLKVAGSKHKIYINGHPMNIWIDSRSPIFILKLDDLKKTVGRTGINLKQDDMEDDEFLDYSNNRIKMLGSMEVELDKEIDKQLAQGHIEKLQDYSDRYFVSPIIITVKRTGPLN